MDVVILQHTVYEHNLALLLVIEDILYKLYIYSTVFGLGTLLWMQFFVNVQIMLDIKIY